MESYVPAPLDQPSRWERPLIASGIVAGAMFVTSMVLFAGVVALQMPPMDAAAPDKAAFYATMAVSPIYSATRLLIFAQLAPLALFFGGLYGLLRRTEGGSGALATAIVLAGLFSSLLAPTAELVEGHLLLGLASAGADPLVVVGFDGMTPVAFSISGLPQVVVLVGTGMLLGASSLVPRWINWFGYVVAVLGLLSVGVMVQPVLVFLGLLSAVLYKVWMIVVSMALVRQGAAIRRGAVLEVTA